METQTQGQLEADQRQAGFVRHSVIAGLKYTLASLFIAGTVVSCNEADNSREKTVIPGTGNVNTVGGEIVRTEQSTQGSWTGETVAYAAGALASLFGALGMAGWGAASHRRAFRSQRGVGQRRAAESAHLKSQNPPDHALES
ncbi:MAG: hypothetical protein KDI13_01980 [Alphaproteobacteria bacterium]|nr:hypothetical protein [Alphaproteobacteria bacterium]